MPSGVVFGVIYTRLAEKFGRCLFGFRGVLGIAGGVLLLGNIEDAVGRSNSRIFLKSGSED